MPIFTKVMSAAEKYNDKAIEYAQGQVAKREEEDQLGYKPKHKSMAKKAVEAAEDFVAKQGDSNNEYSPSRDDSRHRPDNFRPNNEDGYSSRDDSVYSNRTGFGYSSRANSSYSTVSQADSTYNKFNLENTNIVGLDENSMYPSRDENANRYPGTRDSRNASDRFQQGNTNTSSSYSSGYSSNSNRDNNSSYPGANKEDTSYESLNKADHDSSSAYRSSRYETDLNSDGSSRYIGDSHCRSINTNASSYSCNNSYTSPTIASSGYSNGLNRDTANQSYPRDNNNYSPSNSTRYQNSNAFSRRSDDNEDNRNYSSYSRGTNRGNGRNPNDGSYSSTDNYY